MSTTEVWRQEFDQLKAFLHQRLGFPDKDRALQQCLALLEKSGIDGAGLAAVRTLIDYIVLEKVGGLKKRVRDALDGN